MLKVIVPVLEGYNAEGQAVFGLRDATAEEKAEYEKGISLVEDKK